MAGEHHPRGPSHDLGVEQQRAVLDDAMERIWVRRGGTGRRTPAQVLARLTFDWRMPEDLGPVDAAV
jgi:hypothetical protein